MTEESSITPPSGSRRPRSLSVVIPAFNEEALIHKCLDETSEALEQLGCDYEIIVVDDGSSDATADLARAAAAATERIRVLRQVPNAGKGAALIAGTREATCELVAFVDADLEVHPNQLVDLRETLLATRADAVIGSKHHPHAEFDFGAVRYRLSVLYSQIVKVAFRLPVHDTQTGLKLFERTALQRALGLSRVKRFAFDLELLVNLTRLGYRIAETPVKVTTARPVQRMRFRDVAKMALDTFLIWYRSLFTRRADIERFRQQEEQRAGR